MTWKLTPCKLGYQNFPYRVRKAHAAWHAVYQPWVEKSQGYNNSIFLGARMTAKEAMAVCDATKKAVKTVTPAEFIAKAQRLAKQDKLRAELLRQIKAAKLEEPMTEFKFHVKRKWRFDLAWKSERIAVEIQGGTYSNGAHVRGKRYAEDCRKLNAAQLAHWTVLWFPADLIKSGEALQSLERVLPKVELWREIV